MTASDTPDSEAVLTAREIETIEFVARGMSNKEIAQAMGISSRTVQQHLARASRKTDARNRTHLAVSAICVGLVSCVDLVSTDSVAPWAPVHGPSGGS